MITFRLDPNSGVPIYRQIQDQVRCGIVAGQLQAGEQLPTIRALAVELSVNPNTVIKAYSELEREGVLTSEQGSGTFVTGLASEALPERDRKAKLKSLCTEFMGQAARYGFTAEEVIHTIKGITHRNSPP